MLQLYLAKSVSDLDNQIIIPDIKKKDLKVICNSAQKTINEANAARLNGDEEKAYILYMRYLGVVEQLKKHKKFEQERDFISTFLGKKSITDACGFASKIKDSLISRYDSNIAPKKEEIKPKVLDVIMTDVIPIEPKEKTIEHLIDNKISLKAYKLFELFKDDTKKIIVLDTRPSADFEKSHIKYPQCVNIPEECIKAGLTANKLEKELPEKSKYLWSQRASMDLIILLDWSSTEIVTGKTLHLLKTIFMRWDPNVIYKHEPVFLEGGYEDWLLKYPHITTNPHVSIPAEANMDELLDFDYPMLDDHVNFNDVRMDTTTDSILNDENNSTYKRTNPSIDRSSKAAAIKTYKDQEIQLIKVMEKQKKLTKTSLNIEKKRVSAEENWDQLEQNINEGLENEANDLRKGELESEILKLENDQHDVNVLMMENQKLKIQLAELLKDKEASKEPPSVQDSEIPSNNISVNNGAEITPKIVNNLAEVDDESIKKIEKERAILEKKRSALEKEREKKLADARAKKKLSGLQHNDLPDEESATPHNEEHLPTFNTTNLASNTITDQNPKVNTPQYDRTTKPSNNHFNIISEYNPIKRDFYGVYGSEGRGLTGLKNLGNTCYMNSIIQCLNNTSPLVKYFCNGIYIKHIQRNRNETTGKTQGAVAEELAVVVQTLWSDQYRFISPKDLRNVVGKFQSMFRGYEQQDSHEFLIILMDWLHDDLQITIDQKSHIDRLPPADKAWAEYTKSKESLILRLFYGQIKSTVKCLICSKESVTYDTFSNLSLELPADANKCSLKDCLELYLRDEKILGWNCPSCREKRSAVKKLDIARLPPVLVIHFKRFYMDHKDYSSSSYKKKQTYIDFPIHNLNMGNYALPTQTRMGTNYNLYSVSNHYGSMEGGHYTAYCKSAQNSRWYKFDDHLVTEISQRDVISSAAYILFYTSYDSALQ